MQKIADRYIVFKDIVDCNNIEKLRNGFIDTLTHDLKTPVLAQIRVLELLLKGNFGEFTGEQNEILKMTLDSCKYMYEMVMTLISTYRFDGEKFELNITEFDILNLCTKILNEFDPLMKEKGINVILIPKAVTTCIFADYIRIEKTLKALMLNVINNAEVNSNIKIFITCKNNKLKLVIESNSNYINEEKMQKMFSIFTSDDGNYDKIGTGIGLYMVKKIIEKHHGKIIMKSNVYKKSLIGFEIPQKQHSPAKCGNIKIAYT